MGTTYTRPVVNGTPTTGQVVKAAHINEPIDQIYDTILAGGVTDSQLASSSVTTPKLATAAVTAAKMDGTLPDASAMATSAAPAIDKELANKKYVDDQVAAASTWQTSGVEVFNATFSSASTFQDLDLSVEVGSNSVLVLLEVKSSTNMDYVAKPKGTGGTYTAHENPSGFDMGCAQAHFFGANEFAYLIISTDSNGVLQHGADTGTAIVKLIGFVS